MAQIPVYTPARILEVGSPVPASSPSNTAGGMRGGSEEAFGKAITDLGLLLAKEHTQAQREKDRLEAEYAVGVARQLFGKERANQMAMGFPTDVPNDNGYAGVEQFKERANQGLEAISEKLGSPRARAMFRAAIQDDLSRDSNLVWANELQKKEKSIDLLQKNFFQQQGATIRAEPENPGSALVMSLAKAKIEVENSKIIPDSQKVEMYDKIKKEYIDQAVLSFTDRKDFDGARALLTGNGEGSATVKEVLSAGEISQKMDYLNTLERHHVNDQYTREQRAYNLQQRELEVAQTKEINAISSMLFSAGSDQTKIDAAHMRIGQSTILTAAQKKDLLTDNLYTKRGDDQVEAEFHKRVFHNVNPNAIESYIESQYPKNLSLDRRQKLLDKLDSLKNVERASPEMKAVVTASSREIIERYKILRDVIDPDTGIKTKVPEINPIAYQKNAEFLADIANNKGPLTTAKINELKMKALGNQAPITNINESSSMPGVRDVSQLTGRIQSLIRTTMTPEFKTLPEARKRAIREELESLKQQRLEGGIRDVKKGNVMTPKEVPNE